MPSKEKPIWDKKRPESVGKSSPAYWANKVKWAEGGEVQVAQATQPRSLVKGLLEGIRDWTQSRQPQAAPQPAAAPVRAAPVPTPIAELAPRDNPYYQAAVRLAEKYDLPRDVFVSLVHQESRFNPQLRSPKGAYGLTQLMPRTAKELGVNPRDPMQNLEGGARYLRQQLDTFGSLPLALAAYNAGPGNVRKHDGIPPFRETQNYVREIMSNAGLKPGFAEGGSVDDKIKSLTESMRKMFSLDTPKDMTTGETVADIAAGFVPGVGTAQAARDFERARREGDKLGMGLAGVGMIPVVGGMVKPGKAAAKSLAKSLAEMAEQYGTKVAPQEQKMLQGVYRGYAGENVPAKTAFGTDTYFVSPQKRVADYYAQRRAAETGAAPHAEMVLVDPATLRNQPYGLSIPIDKYNPDFLITRARRVDPDEVKSRTQLYAQGGAVQYDPLAVDSLVDQLLEVQNG